MSKQLFRAHDILLPLQKLLGLPADDDIDDEFDSFERQADSVNLEEYLELRDAVNDAFQVGDVFPYDESQFDHDSVYLDLIDGYYYVFDDRYPSGVDLSDQLTFEDRVAWRDRLIDMLDGMVSE
ncbi:hypothetical protein ACP3V3_19675 [Vibrio sp. PNB22_3_1]